LLYLGDEFGFYENDQLDIPAYNQGGPKKPAASTRKRRKKRQERGEEDRIPILDRDSARESNGIIVSQTTNYRRVFLTLASSEDPGKNIGKEGEKSDSPSQVLNPRKWEVNFLGSILRGGFVP
jgi:hypothetical protein